MVSDEVILIEVGNCTAQMRSALLGQLKGLSQAGNGKPASFIDVEYQRLSFSDVADIALALNAATKERDQKIDLSALQPVASRG